MWVPVTEKGKEWGSAQSRVREFVKMHTTLATPWKPLIHTLKNSLHRVEPVPL